MESTLKEEVHLLFTDNIVTPIGEKIEGLKIAENFGELKKSGENIEKIAKQALMATDFRRGKEKFEKDFREHDKKIDSNTQSVIDEIGKISKRLEQLDNRLEKEVIVKENGLQGRINMMVKNQSSSENRMKKEFKADLEERQNHILNVLDKRDNEADKRFGNIESTCNAMLKRSEFEGWKLEIECQNQEITKMVKSFCDDNSVVEHIDSASVEFGKMRKLVIGLMAGNCVMFAGIIIMFAMMFLG